MVDFFITNFFFFVAPWRRHILRGPHLELVPRPVDDPKRQQALKDGALSRMIYGELVKEYSGGLPSDTTLRSELVASKKFNPKFVGDFITDFRTTLEFAGLADSSPLEFSVEGESVVQVAQS